MLETGLTKPQETPASRQSMCYDLIHLVNVIPVENYDVLGHVYESLIRNFC